MDHSRFPVCVCEVLRVSKVLTWFAGLDHQEGSIIGPAAFSAQAINGSFLFL